MPTLSSSIRAVILDFDGLIIDSESPLFDIWCEIYGEHGETLTLENWQHALGTHGGFDPFADLAARVATALDRDGLSGYVSREHWRRCGQAPLLPGVRDLLIEARALGLRTAVASSSSLEWVGPWLHQHALDPLLDAVCTRYDVVRLKPAPDLFLLAAERLGIGPTACVVFEDSPNGIRAAKAAGMHVVAVPNALTRSLTLPDPDLVIPSLASVRLAAILERLQDAPREPGERRPG